MLSTRRIESLEHEGNCLDAPCNLRPFTGRGGCTQALRVAGKLHGAKQPASKQETRTCLNTLASRGVAKSFQSCRHACSLSAKFGVSKSLPCNPYCDCNASLPGPTEAASSTLRLSPLRLHARPLLLWVQVVHVFFASRADPALGRRLKSLPDWNNASENKESAPGRATAQRSLL